MLQSSTQLSTWLSRCAGIVVLLLWVSLPGEASLWAGQSCCDQNHCYATAPCGDCNWCDARVWQGKLNRIWRDFCSDDFCCRERFFGDVGGVRASAAARGFCSDNSFTQFYQGVASGGRDQSLEYGGKFDSYYALQGEKLGLNGLMGIMHVESRYGRDANSESGALAFPNGSMLYPLPDQWKWSISELVLIQSVCDEFAVTIGKYNSMDLFNMLYRNQGRGIDGFMNLNLLLPGTLLRTTNLSFNGAGVLRMHGKEIQSALMVYDTVNTSTTLAPDLFAHGSVVFGYHRFFTNFHGLPGSHGFMANYSNRTYAVTDPLSYTVLPGEGIAARRKSGSWSLAYLADQLLYVDRCHPCRNLRFFSTWGIADKETNPYAWTGTVALQGSGLNSSRPADTIGIGYFYSAVSSDLKDIVRSSAQPAVGDIQGVEFYYNTTITPWLHVTSDLQVVENERVSDDTALILGCRLSIDM